MHRSLRLFSAALSAALISIAPAFAGIQEDISRLQHEWEQVKYRVPAADQEKSFAQLAAEADKILGQYPDKPEALIWHGIVTASYAGAKGGMGALSLVRNARSDFEKALAINPNALTGSAYTSLGSLYYQVPGWPISFGNDKTALEYLNKGLAINPDGIDPNYFLADYLYRNGDLDGAERALRKALQAAPRPGRKLADEGRRGEINQLLEKIAEKRK